MKKSREQGATLALVIVLTFVIVLIGVGFFFLSRIIGGGKELQHATDSGNLNVAREVLRRPGIPLAGGNETNEFGNLTDPVTGQVNLLTFNRLVGKAVLIAANASAEGTTQAGLNAANVVNMIEGPGGIGGRLMNRISTHSQISNFFDSLSTSNSTRMLKNQGDNSQIQGVSQETKVSYMARNGASNAFVAANQIPAGSGFSFSAPNVISKTVNGVPRIYLAGYVPLATGLALVQPMAVPVRPGEQPHLVAENDFNNNSNSPLPGGASSLIPPNTFHSAGQAQESMQTMANLRMRSSAIVGALNVDFPASIPRGFIVVNNTGSMSFSGNIGGGNNIFGNQMMAPNYIEVATLPDGTPVISENAQALEAIKTFVNANPGANVPSNLASQIDSPSSPTQSQLQQLGSANISHCDNTNSFAGGDPNCVNNLPTFQQLYGSVDSGGNVNVNGLMAVEQFKCFILQVRAGFAIDGGGCAMANAPAACTGLKSYNHAAQYCLPCNFGSVGTLRALLSQSSGSGLESDLRVRMMQIKPTAQDGEIESVLNCAVPFGRMSYIYMNASGNLVLDSNYPSLYPVPPLVPGTLPDGPTRTLTSGNFNLNGTIVNVPGNSCEGYPNPWDCPAVPAEGEDKVTWTPSSGFRNLLGILQFQNCAHGGGNWCCPC